MRMEVEMNIELEMAEIRPRVYDILHPTPVSLKQLSAIVASFEIWRYEINTQRTRNKLSKICCKRICWERFISETTLPGKPRVINDLVDEYIFKFKFSEETWHRDHFITFFMSYRCLENCILNDFDDFVIDFKGDIDYVRTAERMMRCDRLKDTVKFEIACMYCLEDDIRRIWPSVSETMTSTNVKSGDCSQEKYWIGSLTNQLDKTDVFNYDLFTTHKTRFRHRSTRNNRSSMEYFWNRIPPDNRLQKATDMLGGNDLRVGLARFILPKLDDQQLAKFANCHGYFLMMKLLDDLIDEGIVILPTWMYIRNFMNERQFLELSEYMLKLLASHDDDNNRLFLCREIWNSAPHNLKQLAVREILSSTELFNMLVSQLNNNGMKSTPKFVKLLLNILLSATFNERSSFWNNCWHQLIALARSKHLQQFMKLCIGNENKITEFKTNVVANSEHLRQLCISLVKGPYFEKLNDLLKFCYPEVQQMRNFEQEILQLALLGEDCQFSWFIVHIAEDLNEFINKTYDDADLSVEFKNQLLMSPAFEEFVSFRVRSNNISCLNEIEDFVDVFKPTEQTLEQIKTRVIDSFKESLTGDGSSRDLLKRSSLNQFLLWCLGSDAEVEKFRRNYALRVVWEDW
ncbi:uncharacterized protein LOC135847460 [Planococcus citri]|uniref:uncharacterized protein LOC135847460 n=1 Tax=Planococcus citri TaxID=170843 RepID=UPI0031F8232D